VPSAGGHTLSGTTGEACPACMTLLVGTLLLAQPPGFLKHPILPTWPYMELHVHMVSHRRNFYPGLFNQHMKISIGLQLCQGIYRPFPHEHITA